MNYFIYPLLWLGLIATVIMYYHRIKKERHFVRIAVNKDFFEGRHFIKFALIAGVISSVISLALGLVLPVQFINSYELLAIVALFFADLFSAGSWAVLGAGIAVLASQWLGAEEFTGQNIFFPAQVAPHLGAGILLLACFYFLTKFLLAAKVQNDWLSPRIKEGKRGRRIAHYHWHDLTVFPVFLLVPGNSIHSVFSWWPILNIGAHGFTLFVMPVFASAVVNIYKRLPQEALVKYRQELKQLLILTVILVVVSYFLPVIAIYACVLILAVELGFAIRRRRNDRHAPNWYVETSNGVRVVAVQPNTPAEKMNLQPGDIILECNGVSVNSEDELYEALQKDPVYCHLKVETYTGDLKIKESAIFSDSPHEIGLILFRQEEA